ncbi:MAG: hypothetical protein L6Q34_14480, partial [Nitrospira sp.]|nr:hypothetical protein [Nitrospira sp.]
WQAPDLRRWEDLERLGTPFERSAHTAEVRHVATGRGRYSIPSIGILVWRLRHDSLTRSPVVPVDDRRFLLSPLGAPVALVT